MNFKYLAIGLLSLTALTNALADDYVLSPDGSAVVRINPVGTASAASLIGTPLPGGFTATTGSGGSISTSDYSAGFTGGTGGATIRALYDNGAALPAGQALEWVQVITTNNALGSATSPYLDNAAAPTAPYYSYTAANRTAGLAPSKLNFYDFSTRDPAVLSTTNPITWNASLYPVLTNGTALTVRDGVTWGWTMKNAMVGSTAGTFTSPAPASATVIGVGSSNFSWGLGDPSSLSFAAVAFDAKPNVPFVVGKLTFHNGTNFNPASSVDLNTAISFANVAEKNFVLNTRISMFNTPNTSDPIASADQVLLDEFGLTFNVLEGQTASVNVLATLSTGLSGAVTGTASGAALDLGNGFDPKPTYTLKFVGLADPTAGGFVTSVPEPATYASMLAGLLLLAALARLRKS